MWSDGSTGKEIIVKKPGKYIANVSTYCNSITDTVIVHQKIDDCECFLYAPNAFTPNGDSKNDVFRFESNCTIKGSLRIFNRGAAWCIHLPIHIRAGTGTWVAIYNHQDYKFTKYVMNTLTDPAVILKKGNNNACALTSLPPCIENSNSLTGLSSSFLL